MLNDAPRPAQAAIRTDLGAIFVSIEQSRRAWLITSLSPGAGEIMGRPRRRSDKVGRRPSEPSTPEICDWPTFLAAAERDIIRFGDMERLIAHKDQKI